MRVIHPIPPNLFCVPSALVAITGEPWDCVVLPTLNRVGGNDSLLSDPGPCYWDDALTALRELGWAIAVPKQPLGSVKLWHQAVAWGDKPHPILACVPQHVAVLHRGMVYDSLVPAGCEAFRHPKANRPVEAAVMTWKRRR